MIRFATLAFIAIAMASGASASAQLADLSWYTIDCGGEESIGSEFVLTGGIAQPDASNPITGVNYSLTGGFWPGIMPAANDCPADIFVTSGGVGVVNIDDLFMVVNNWGATGKNAADVTDNGIVDIDDLFAVINGWGACP
jgi:hypothetical protein